MAEISPTSSPGLAGAGVLLAAYHGVDGTPLLIHTNTNDQDVNVLEVERLIQALQAGGRSGFEYRIYEDAPGGHGFNRLDTQAARESRRERWRFLASHLPPARPVR